MSGSMDRTLGLGEWLQLRLHLIVCAWCARYLKQIKFMRRLLWEQTPNDLTGSSTTLLNAEARQRIGQSILEKQNHTSC